MSQNYENVINLLKIDFQNEIFTLKKEQQRQMSQLYEEKSLMERALEEKQKELNKLRYFEVYSHFIEDNKENIEFLGNKEQQPQKSLRKK